MLAKNCMTERVRVIPPELPIADARHVMRRHQIHHLLVVLRGRLVGILSDRDLKSPRREARRAADVMTPDPVVISPMTPVDEAAHVMRAKRINSLPVVQDGKILGILTSSDVLDAFVDLSGVTEPSYHLVIGAKGQRRMESQVRKIVERSRGALIWLHHTKAQRRQQLYLRLKLRHADDVDDIVAAIEAAGLEVSAVLASRGRRRC